MKMMIADLCKITELHRNTIYNLLRRGIFRPVEVISGIMIFDDGTVETIKRHYNDKTNKKLCKLIFNDSTCSSI